MQPPTMNRSAASKAYKRPLILSPVRKASSAKASAGPVDASILTACAHDQAACNAPLCAIKCPCCKKSAALRMTPNARSGSLVIAKNLNNKLMTPAYQLSDTNDCSQVCFSDCCIYSPSSVTSQIVASIEMLNASATS